MEVSGTDIGATIIHNTSVDVAVLTAAMAREMDRPVVPAEMRNSVCFKADFSTADGPQSLTYFGGRPSLPPGQCWPEVTRRGNSHALTFLGQVDLGEIATAATTVLPSTGVLYFFLDTNIINLAGLIDASPDSAPPWRVIYAEAGADHCQPTAAPGNLMPCFGYPYAGTPSGLSWIEHVAWRERYYAYEAPRIRMQPLALQSFLIRNDERTEHDRQMQRAAWIEAFGPPIVRKGFAGVANDRRGELFLLAQFPATNIYLEIFAAGLLKNIVGPWENKKLHAIGSDHVPALRRILAEIRPDNLFAPTSADQQDRVLSIMQDLAARDPSVTFTLNRLLRTAYFWGSSLSLSYSPDTARMAPDELAGITRELFYPLHGDVERPDRISCTLHQMLGYGTEVHGEVRARADSDIMLMQFDSDNGFGWMFGDCGVAQFWIAPEDLAARRFDRVTATVEGS